MSTKIPGIPRPPANLDIETRRFLETLTEIIEIRLGTRGDPLDRAVTARELIASGVAAERKTTTRFDTDDITSTTTGLAQPAVSSTVSAPALASIASGLNTPENRVIAAPGSLFLRTDGGSNTTLYIKESGLGNTGWVAK